MRKEVLCQILTRGGEQTINPQEFQKNELEMKIRGSKSFYELLTNMEDETAGSDGKTKYSRGEIFDRMTQLFEQFNQKGKLKTSLLTSNLGLRETFIRLINEYSKKGPKLVIDQFIVASGSESSLPIDDFPLEKEDWFKRDTGEAISECTIIGINDLKREKYQHYYGPSPRKGYLIKILNTILKYQE